MLDGASAFEQVDVPTELYVDHLAASINQNIEQQPDAALTDVVAAAIQQAAQDLELRPGNSPSSTVSVLRAGRDVVDLYCLGDSTIYYGGIDGRTKILTDARMAKLDIPEHKAYRKRIFAGHGFDSRHHELLVALQREQRRRRNRGGGYWIAEAIPEAAHHGYSRTVPRDQLTWAVLATDGAYEPMLHLGLADWPRLAQQVASELENVLEICRTWERQEDPTGLLLPRAKVSDDKTLAAVVL